MEQRADKRPVLSDLRASGGLGQNVDVVLFIHRPEMYDVSPASETLTEIIVAKHRNGPTHSGIGLVFRKELAKFDTAPAWRPEQPRIGVVLWGESAWGGARVASERTHEGLAGPGSASQMLGASRPDHEQGARTPPPP